MMHPVLVALLIAGVSATAASVGPTGYTSGFGTHPPVADWATLSIAGAPTDTYNPDVTVNASVSASGVTQTVSDGGNPPVSNASAVWSSAGQYLQTRPTANLATVLMGRFVNNTGTNATQITLSYLFTIAASDAIEEAGLGTRVYFSLTGAANSWTNLPTLNSTSSSAGSSMQSASVSLNWTNGGTLFLVWFDDNSSDGTDPANQYDNFSLRVSSGTPTQFASVGPAGYMNGFGTQPATEWATLSIAGAPTDTYSPDAAVNASVSAISVAARTVSDGGNPPEANASAVWSSSGLYLQTRPTGNLGTVLMGRFVNNTGTNATQITLSYWFTIADSGTAEEAGAGTRVYFSLTGAPNSWTNVPALNTTSSAAGSSIQSASVSLNWTNGGNLFLVWFDDNARDGTDSANQYDNFSLRVTSGTPTNFFSLVSAPIHGATLLSGSSVIASAFTGNATAPYTVEYFTNSGAGNATFASAGTRATAPYSINLGDLPDGTYRIYAVSTDSAGVPLSANSPTNTFSVADSIVFKLSAPSDGSTFAHTNPVVGRTTIAGGTAPYSVQFYFDNLPSGTAVTSPPYERNFGGLAVGDHTIQATVTDAKGWVSNSLVSTIHVTGPLAASLTPANGSVFPFGTSLSLTGAVAGGEAPYAAQFYVNGQVAGSLSSPPFIFNFGALPAGSYTCYVHATDSSMPRQEAHSSTNRITILPPALRIMPLGDSITYGAGAPGGYRAPLYQLLTNAGYHVDFLGTQTGNGAASLPDPQHEGYPGATISAIDGLVPNMFRALPEPDIILLLLGVNDYLQNDRLAEVTNRLEALVVRLATNWVNTKIVVASLTSVSEPRNSQIQTTFNIFLPSICERQRSLGRQVYFTDMHSAVPLADMPDQLHPNQLGYRKMATNWFAAVNLLACGNCPPRFIVHPKGQSMLPGTNVTLTAEVIAGGAPVQYQWRFEGTDIPSAINATYSFTNASIAHQGNYSVAATDTNGTTVSSNAFVFLFVRPVFVVNPFPQTVLQGGTATFTAIATGAPPIWYRWQRSGRFVDTNNTGVFVITNVQSSDIIRAVATNFASGVNGVLMTPSSGVALTMLPDFDGDRMADAWEAQFNLDTNNVADALLDSMATECAIVMSIYPAPTRQILAT
jgi:lysophospholipase L1-like esterase